MQSSTHFVVFCFGFLVDRPKGLEGEAPLATVAGAFLENGLCAKEADFQASLSQVCKSGGMEFQNDAGP